MVKYFLEAVYVRTTTGDFENYNQLFFRIQSKNISPQRSRLVSESSPKKSRSRLNTETNRSRLVSENTSRFKKKEEEVVDKDTFGKKSNLKKEGPGELAAYAEYVKAGNIMFLSNLLRSLSIY